ncbi:MAG: hypothetical protein LOY00_08910 [Methylocaldum sp.]|nr:hypothetical protein [Methylocaldum sp.]
MAGQPPAIHIGFTNIRGVTVTYRPNALQQFGFVVGRLLNMPFESEKNFFRKTSMMLSSDIH